MDVLNGPINYWLAFLAGLLGSAHCIGMCGALVSGFFMKFGAGKYNDPLPYLIYHACRISVYTLIGIIAATVGNVFVSTGGIGAAQGVLQMGIGLFIVILGLDMLGLSPLRISFQSFVPQKYVRKLFVNATRRGVYSGAAIGGVMNGMIPCPLTFALAVKATTASGPIEGGLLMLFFGAGTLPSMLFVSVAFGILGVKTRGWLLKGAAILVVVMGVGTVLQGANYFHIMRGLIAG
jgi:sulfite exporter TauE/SafE